MVDTVSLALTRGFDLLVAPFSGNPTLALVALSLLCGALAILIFRAVSDQPGIRRARAVLTGRILEMHVYRNDFVLILRALGGALWSNVAYLRRSLPAVVVLAGFVALFVIQLDARFGHAALQADGKTTITLRLDATTDPLDPGLSIQTADGAHVDAAAVRVPDRREVSWRLRVDRPGTHRVTFVMPTHQTYAFDLVAEPGSRVIGRTRSRGAIDALIHPGLPPFAEAAGLEAIDVQYPPAAHALLGWRVHWFVVFLVWSLAGALVVKSLLGVAV